MSVFAAMLMSALPLVACRGGEGGEQQPEQPDTAVSDGRVVVARFLVEVPDLGAAPDAMLVVTPLAFERGIKPTFKTFGSVQQAVSVLTKAKLTGPGVWDAATKTLAATARIDSGDPTNNWDEPLLVITSLTSSATDVRAIEAPGQTDTFAGTGGPGSNYAFADIEHAGAAHPFGRQKILFSSPSGASFSLVVDVTAIETTDSVAPDRDDDFWNTEPERAGHDCDDSDPTKFPGGGACDTVDASLDAGGGADASLDSALEADAAVDTADGADTAADVSDDSDADAATSVVCGDGIRDPAKEECDDGLGTSAAPGRTCTSDCHAIDVLILPSLVVDGGTAKSRTLQEGRHTVAAAATSAAVVFTETDSTPVKVALTTFDSKGVASNASIPFATGTMPALTANPVVAALPGGKWAAAWNELGGDGDSLGVALRAVDPSASTAVAPTLYANTTTEYSQHDPDILWTGSELVVAWIDDSNVARGTDIKMRRFSSALVPVAGEEELAITLDDEADVALANFGSGWAAAWRSARGGSETLKIESGPTTWSIGPFLPGPYGSKPALAALDATHLVVVFVQGDETDGSNFLLRAAVLDVAAPGAATSTPIDTISRPSQPNAVAAGGRVYVAWREDALPGDAKGEELWLKEVALSSTGLDVNRAAVRLPSDVEHLAGDQRHPALAAFGSSMLMAWDDLGPFAGTGSNVVAEVAGVPLLRLTHAAKCTDDGVCGGTPPPHCDVTTSICVGCGTKGDCRGSGLACETTGNTCVECAADSDCPSVRPKCHPATHTCKASCTSTTCVGATVCDSTSGLCVQCTSDAQCGGGKCDTTAKKCVDCLSDADCDADSPVCDSSHACVAKCKVSSDCSVGYKCALSGVCYECIDNADCGPKGICSPEHRCIGG